jgi:hypothetical protein
LTGRALLSPLLSLSARPYFFWGFDEAMLNTNVNVSVPQSLSAKLQRSMDAVAAGYRGPADLLAAIQDEMRLVQQAYHQVPQRIGWRRYHDALADYHGALEWMLEALAEPQPWRSEAWSEALCLADSADRQLRDLEDALPLMEVA